MGRPIKKGFDYFRVKETLFSDTNTLRLMQKYPLKGVGLYIHILSQLYAEKESGEPGYYLNFNSDDIFKLSRCTMTDNEELIISIVKYLCELNFFDQKMLNTHKILTAANIQERFIEMSKICDRKKESYHIRPEFCLIEQVSKPEISINPLEKPVSPPETSDTNKNSAPNKANDNQSNSNNSEANIISLFQGNQKHLNRDRLLEILLIEKNYALSEYERFINHYEKNDWVDANGNKIKNPYAAAKNWEMIKNKLFHVKPEFHENWKQTWESYKSELGMVKAAHLLHVKPTLYGNKLTFNCTRKICDSCENNLRNLKSILRNVYGQSVILEYNITDYKQSKSS